MLFVINKQKTGNFLNLWLSGENAQAFYKTFMILILDLLKFNLYLIAMFLIFEFNVRRSMWVVEQKKHDARSAEFIKLTEDIFLLDEQILPIQNKYDGALGLAGLKQVRSATSARVNARYADTKSQMGDWSVKQDSSVNKELKSTEISEVDKLKAEMQEMKKMMQEQAELIKALTAKQ